MPNEKKKMPLAKAASKAVKAGASKKSVSTPKPKAKQNPMADTSKSYNQRLMTKSSSMPMPALDSSMTKKPKAYSGKSMKSLDSTQPRQRTISTIQRIEKSSDGTVKKGPVEKMKMKKISQKEYNR